LVASAPIAGGLPVTLALHVKGGLIAFDYTVGGERQTLKSDLDAALLTTDRAGGFVGTVVGLYHDEPR
jgi:alpha-N-arabinofuranosidase